MVGDSHGDRLPPEEHVSSLFMLRDPDWGGHRGGEARMLRVHSLVN